MRFLRSAAAVCAAVALLPAARPAATAQPEPKPEFACPGDNGGLTLSAGFCASIFADHLGHARHMALAPNGVLYVNSWSGRYYRYAPPPAGGFLVALKDTTGSGHADAIERFGAAAAQGAEGGTGIAYYKGAIYAEEADKILRYALPAHSILPKGEPEIVVSGLPLTGDHPMHPFTIDADGNIYVNVGSATNACQIKNRVAQSPGHVPCAELITRAGICRFDANTTGQRFSPAARYATGIRNAGGFAFDASGRLFVTQHGRDQLWQNWPRFYNQMQGAELPAEEIVALQRGADYGWPECYFDGFQKKLVLAPEYGGDGGHKVGACADKKAPVASFPSHWAPNDLLIYTGTAFPAAYRGGAFIAFHGSWNRAPAPQGGYDVVFQPFKDGRAFGPFVIFADGFAGAVREPGRAAYRPTGFAMGPDGALYISDDVRGRIWRVTFHGAANAKVAPAPPPKIAALSSGEPGPPEGLHPDAGRPDSGALPVPAGATKEEVALGDRIFHGEAAAGTCSGCHGSDGKGSAQGPSLVNREWAHGDGSLGAIRKAVADGVPKPRHYVDPMPPKGGAPLTRADVTAVAAYVWALGHRGSR